MRSSYKILNPEGIYFVTSTIVDWIPIFTTPEYYLIIIDNLKFYQKNNNTKVFAYVILKNHFHLIVSDKNLSKTMQSFKKYTAKQIIQNLVNDGNFELLKNFEHAKKDYKITSKYQIWQEGFFPKEILTQEELNQKLEYIHMNPVKKGYVELPEEWIYSSACDYLLGQKGLIEIELI